MNLFAMTIAAETTIEETNNEKSRDFKIVLIHGEHCTLLPTMEC
jgi:hypothetical protein